MELVQEEGQWEPTHSREKVPFLAFPRQKFCTRGRQKQGGSGAFQELCLFLQTQRMKPEDGGSFILRGSKRSTRCAQQTGIKLVTLNRPESVA